MATRSTRRKSKTRSRSRTTRSARAAEKPRSGWRLTNHEVEEALLTGKHAPELEDLFGPPSTPS